MEHFRHDYYTIFVSLRKCQNSFWNICDDLAYCARFDNWHLSQLVQKHVRCSLNLISNDNDSDSCEHWETCTIVTIVTIMITVKIQRPLWKHLNCEIGNFVNY